MILARLVDLSLQMWMSSVNLFCTCIGALSGIGVDKCGNMGSGSVFSPWTDVLHELCMALDMCLVVEVRVGGRDERRWGLVKHSRALFKCELNLGFEL